MTYKTILLHLDPGNASRRRTAIAIELACAFDAHLIGLYYVHPFPVPGYTRPDLGSNYVTAWRRLWETNRSKTRAAFQDAVERARVSYEWRCKEPLLGETFETHARYADLAILGQTDPESNETYAASDFPEFVCLATGRPVLVAPYAGECATVGERVLVAWNASREATRAVTDSLPLLQRAKQVTVLAINPKGRGELPCADIAWYLARHGVKVEAMHTHSSEVDTGNVLLSHAADMAADLLVIGCYGHSRLKEMALGGVTRTLLKEMTLPVLMSH